MEPKDFKSLLDKAYTTSNENGELSQLLSNIQDTFEQTYQQKLESDKLYQETQGVNQSLNEMNEKLRNVNMDLFLKVGSTKTSPPLIHQEEKKHIPLIEVYE